MKDTKKIEQAASLEELFERLDRVIGGLEVLKSHCHS